MEFTVNERTINTIISDGKSNEDIIMFLNQVIDEEFEKDEPNCDLIDDCINAIADISENAEMPALRLVVTCNSIKEIVNPKRKAWKQLNVALRVAIIAAIIASSTFTVNAAVKLVTNVDIIGKIVHSISSFINRNDDDGELTTELFVPVTTTTTTQTTTNVGASIARPLETIEETTTQKHIEIIDAEDDEETTQVETSITEESTIEEMTQPETCTTEEFTTEEITQTSTTSQDTINTTENVTQPTDPYTEPPIVEFTGIRAEFNSFKTAYIYGESLSYDGLKIYACYSDHTENEVPLDSCAYSKNLDMNITANYTLSVTYKGCTVKADITVRPDEATRFSDICENDDWKYLLTENGAYITAYKGNDKDISVDSIDSKPVVAITGKVFKDSDITSFSSSTLKVIYQEAFENCQSLVKCDTPNVVSIGNSAFKNDNKLVELKFSSSLNKLGTNAFEKTAITELTVPSSIIAIPDYLCNNCEKLEKVVFKGNVTEVGDMAFNSCYELKNVVGAGRIKNVGFFAFNENEQMKLDEIPKLENVGASAFSYCISVEFGRIGNSFKSLGANAFDNCEGITEVVIPSAVEVVPASCFNGVDLTALTIENGVREIKTSAFRSNDLTSITIPKSVEYIGEYALYSTKLRAITIKGMETEIAPTAFYISKRVTINGYENSSAQKFAEDNSIKFVKLEEGE